MVILSTASDSQPIKFLSRSLIADVTNVEGPGIVHIPDERPGRVAAASHFRRKAEPGVELGASSRNAGRISVGYCGIGTVAAGFEKRYLTGR
jgi:hypothetical protein